MKVLELRDEMKSLPPELTGARLACGEAPAFIPCFAVAKDLDDKNLGRPSHRLSRQFGTCELRTLPTKSSSTTPRAVAQAFHSRIGILSSRLRFCGE